MDKEKEIKKLRAQKAKCKRQGNQRLVAEYANSIGNLCSELGEYRQAIDEHECELTICENLNDIEGEAIACRKLGECYIELVELEPANQYVNKYIELARNLPNKVELQRAYVTMGRLCIVEIPTLIPATTKRKQSEKKAESAFMKALEWCGKIRSTLTSSEYHEMRARTILNLGLLADLKGEEKEAISNFENASTIARKSNLYATLIASLNNRADLLARQGQFTEARSVVQDALGYRKCVELADSVTSVKLYAQVTAEMGDIGVGLDMVKAIIRNVKESTEKKELMSIAIKLYKIILAKRKVPLSNDDDKRKIFEKIGDYCCELGAYHHALLSYQKTLDILNELKMGHETLPPILVSMARTYQDLKKYDQAISYLCQEAKIQQQFRNFDQAAKSLLNVANCMESGNCNTQMIQQCYKKAESHARSAEDPKLLLLVLKNYRDSLKSLECRDGYDDCCRKIEQISQEYGISAESQQESQVSEVYGDDSSDGGFQLSDHSSDEERETEVINSSRCRPFKISRNEIGETKLHQAVIKGKKDLVVDLLNKGHPTDVRDHAGWLPIHEAAVHDRVEIARLLVDQGTDINDRAGKEGITPLHDACSSGCTEMLQFLMESGASVIAKDNENLYPLDHLVQYLHRSYEELSNDELQELEELEGMLRTAMLKKGITPKLKLFKEQRQQQKEDIALRMPEMLPCSKVTADNEEEVSLLSEELPAPIPLSPEVSAAEMYKSAVANVRKSAKRLTIPKSCGRERSGVESVPALLAQDCDKNMLATGAWLVNDDCRSPVRKRQRQHNSAICVKTKLSTADGDGEMCSSPSIVDDTPEILSPISVDALNTSQTDTPDTVPTMRRVPLPSLSPIMDEGSQLSQPLTPVFDQSDVEQPKTPGDLVDSSEGLLTNDKITSAVLELDALLEAEGSGEGKGVGEKGSDNANGSFKADSDTQVIARSQSPVTKVVERRLSDENAGCEPAVHDWQSIEWSQPQDQRSTNASAVHESKIASDVFEDQKAGNSVFEDLRAGNSAFADQNAGNVLDELFCNENVAPQEMVRGKTSKLIPTSTPLRKRRIAKDRQDSASSTSQPISRVKTFTTTSVTATNSREKGNETVMTPTLSIRPIDMALNSSVTTCTNSVAHLGGVGLDSSYYQNTRVIVQWKKRALLIPVPRNESLSIGWLIEEFLRRITKRRSSQPIPELNQIYLTRANDGAELFSDDAIQDLLADNEKVLVMDESEENQ